MGKPVKYRSSLKGRQFNPSVYGHRSSRRSKLSRLPDVVITPSGSEAIQRIRLLMDMCGIPWVRLDRPRVSASSSSSQKSTPQDLGQGNKKVRSFNFPEPIPLQDGQCPKDPHPQKSTPRDLPSSNSMHQARQRDKNIRTSFYFPEPIPLQDGQCPKNPHPQKSTPRDLPSSNSMHQARQRDENIRRSFNFPEPIPLEDGQWPMSKDPHPQKSTSQYLRRRITFNSPEPIPLQDGQCPKVPHP